MDLQDVFISNLKRFRKEQHITQEKLAELTGLSIDYIGKIEVHINKPGLRALIKISKALNVDIRELFNF